MKQINKDITLCFILLILVISIIPITTQSQVFENKYGKLEVYPNVSKEILMQKQFWNLTWFYPDNYIDIAFRFDNELIYGKIYFWNGDDYVDLKPNHIIYNDKHFYVLNDVPFVKDIEKKGYWEYIPDNPINSSGKWDMFIKLSDDTWEYAFENDRLIHIDPYWNSNWSYMKVLYIDDACNDCEMFLNLSFDVGDFNASGNCQVDFDDIRFTDIDNTTELSYWIEYKVNGDYAHIWIETPVDIEDDDRILMYYGNDVVSSNSDGFETFIFFDDFENVSIDPKWTDWWKGHEGNIETGKFYSGSQCWRGDSGDAQGLRYTYGSDQDDRIVEGWMWDTDEGVDEYMVLLGSDSPPPDSSTVSRCFGGVKTDSYDTKFYGRINGGNYELDELRNEESWSKFAVWLTGDDTYFYINDVLELSNTNNGILRSVVLGSLYTPDFDYFVDAIRVRLWCSTMPSFNSSGGEVIAPISSDFNVTNINPVNNSEILCLNLSELCVDINFSCGTGVYINISVVGDNGLFWSNTSGNGGNDTYCFNVDFPSNVNFTEGKTYTWWVNVSSSCADIDVYYSNWFNFSCSVGCPCYEEIDTAIYWILQTKDDTSEMWEVNEETMIEIEFAESLIILALAIAMLFLGYHIKKKSGGIYITLGGFFIIALQISSPFSLVFRGGITLLGLIIIILGTYKLFFQAKEGQENKEGD